MFTLTRRRARLLRAAVRRCIPKGGPRGPDPVVRFVAGPAGGFVFVALPEVAVGCRLSPAAGPPAGLSVPLSMLAACEGADDSPVSFVSAGPMVQVAWNDRGRPRAESVSVPATPPPPIPALPEAFATVGRSFPEALHEAGRCAAKENGRYALTRVQVRGEAGQVIGSDAKQALVVGGFRFPFADDLLVPAVPLFGMKELAEVSPVRAGRFPEGLCVGVGDWLVWLTADPEGRYPDVAAVIRRNAGGARIRVGHDDAARLLTGLPKLPGGGDELSPVTLEVGEFPCVRAGDPEQGNVVEVGLADSAGGGPPASWALDRRYLHRALLLGFRDFSARQSSQTAVAALGDKVYLFALLDPESAVPASPAVRREPPAPAPMMSLKPSLSLLQRNTQMRPPDPVPNGHAEPAGGDAVDPLAEAEALRVLLGEAVGRSARLVAALKNYRRQRKALESAWASLQQLKLGAGG